MVHIGVMDCTYLLQSLVAGVVTVANPSGNSSMQAKNEAATVLSCSRNGYILAVPFLFALLAINRLTVMLKIKQTVYLKRFFNVGYKPSAAFKLDFQIGMIAAWIIYLPLTLTLHYGVTGIKFYLEKGGYTYEGPETFAKFMGMSGPVLQSLAFACYLIIIVLVLAQVI
ncbi:hypothetical protein L596_029317 [Steinernema carpocapsae]|uniref:Uncharacterized protein n=1 Tax=Steinernema carpocapsae TaxID=34508 RepID=A0A4U5LUA0_STECR|nr:hypothetical protein L596_029317 [Steinernema carpocapsae]